MQMQSESERYLRAGLVREVLFSGTTYQIEVVDEKSGESMWPFFQFDGKGNLKDAFCSCESEEECVHLAAAKLKIYSGHSRPLHLRFQDSFWNCLGQIEADTIGYDEELLTKKKEGLYFYTNGVSFQIWAKTKKMQGQLEKLLENREKETPETSIKFSNLPQKEISHWKAGRASPELRYELSFWADLAKWLMLLQDEGLSYTFSYRESEEGLPTKIEVKWKGLELAFTLDEADLPRVIPSFATVDFPLKVHKDGDEKIKAITYDPQKRAFHIKRAAEAKTRVRGEERPIGNWIYVPGEGFYPRDGKGPLAGSVIEEKRIASILTLHRQEVEKHLQGIKIHEKPVSLSYAIHFDRDWNWHFEAYLFEKGDLQKGGSAFFGEWAYVDQKGFYPVEGALFEPVEKTIPTEEVSHFVNTHRIWLNTQQEFRTHLASVETHLIYSVSTEGRLQFCSRLYAPEEALDTHDFGDWIYFEKEGFFSKKHSRLGAAVRPGVEIAQIEVDRFIKKHREELENITGFFSPRLPLKSRGVKVVAKSATSLMITPDYQPEDLEIRFFGDFVYVDGEGFSELPAKMRLPEKYQKERVVRHDELLRFFQEEFEELKSHITTLDPKLQRPAQIELELRYLVRTAEGGLKAKLFYKTDVGYVAVAELAEAAEKKHHYLFSDGGLIDLHDEPFHWLRQTKRQIYPEAQTIELSTMDFLRLEMTQEIKLPEEATPALEITHSLFKELREFLVIDKPNIKGLKSELRLYQQTGLHWLWFLYRNGLAGLLCDDMGLGKTHQAMALMAAVANQKTARFLIVCPTSVIYHWQDKLALFFPTLKVHTFH
ncbi:MAG: hypothetical protein KR126chlam2_01345, partial [Chlamydiae bacterium]|nr:hypothetical protein [Chlamydiota bacterium]